MSDRLTEGTIVDGRYRVLGRLGAGGMADVYCAEDLQLGRRVALKILYRRFAEDEEFVERFRREASSAAGLQHPHVVAVYDRGEYDGTSYIAMEYVDGRTLKAIVNERGPLPPAEAIDLVVQILRAARFAHKRGVIHRDLKPHNVIVDAEGRAKVTDFGIARAGASDMTQTGSIMGTAQYLSPEQAQGLPVSAQSDIYGIGITLYELLTGRVPFDGESAVAIALKQVNENPVPPSRLNPAVTAQLDGIVLRALDKDPARRFPDADAFIAALEEARAVLPDQTQIAAGLAAAGATAATMLAGPPTESLPVIPPATGEYYPATPLPPPDPRRGSGRWWVAGLILLLVAGAIVAALLLTGGKQVTVPSVVGATQATAEVKLGDSGLSTKAVTKTSDRPQGIVIGQQPEGGSKVDEHSTVTLVVSSGPGEGTIPRVAGLGRRTARKKLVEAGFAVDEQERNDDTVKKDHVIETSPAAGERLQKGETVTLVVSVGPESVTMPGVVGQSRDDAVSTLEDAGFDVAITEQESDTEDPGTVLAQDPAANATVPKGSQVTLTVAKAPTTTELPDVTGKSEDDAIQTLSSAGFTIRRKQQDVDTLADDGKVLSQSPGGGKKVKKGATVTITVGRFNPALNPEGSGGTTTPSTTPTTPTGTGTP